MVGLAFGNFFAGPISDTLGRRKPLFVAMIIFTLASIRIVFVNKYLDNDYTSISSRTNWRCRGRLFLGLLQAICILVMN
ncbi:MFS transporter [Staphylococcus saccharolyticus]|uniref:MFS transporter n=1 Tax=Staphylococcus saccharolyticus TaxID=33028 RepID=UPI003B75C2EA